MEMLENMMFSAFLFSLIILKMNYEKSIKLFVLGCKQKLFKMKMYIDCEYCNSRHNIEDFYVDIICDESNKTIPINSPVRLPSPVINKSGMRIVYTKSVGKFLGRWVPFVGWALTIYDIHKTAMEYNKKGASDSERESLMSAYGLAF